MPIRGPVSRTAHVAGDDEPGQDQIGGHRIDGDVATTGAPSRPPAGTDATTAPSSGVPEDRRVERLGQ